MQNKQEVPLDILIKQKKFQNSCKGSKNDTDDSDSEESCISFIAVPNEFRPCINISNTSISEPCHGSNVNANKSRAPFPTSVQQKSQKISSKKVILQLPNPEKIKQSKTNETVLEISEHLKETTNYCKRKKSANNCQKIEYKTNSVMGQNSKNIDISKLPIKQEPDKIHKKTHVSESGKMKLNLSTANTNVKIKYEIINVIEENCNKQEIEIDVRKINSNNLCLSRNKNVKFHTNNFKISRDAMKRKEDRNKNRNQNYEQQNRKVENVNKIAKAKRNASEKKQGVIWNDSPNTHELHIVNLAKEYTGRETGAIPRKSISVDWKIKKDQKEKIQNKPENSRTTNFNVMSQTNTKPPTDSHFSMKSSNSFSPQSLLYPEFEQNIKLNNIKLNKIQENGKSSETLHYLSKENTANLFNSYAAKETNDKVGINLMASNKFTETNPQNSVNLKTNRMTKINTDFDSYLNNVYYQGENENTFQSNPPKSNSKENNYSNFTNDSKSEQKEKSSKTFSNENQDVISKLKVITDSIVGCHIALTVFFSFYHEWVISRKTVIDEFKMLLKNIEKSKENFSFYAKLFDAVNIGASVASIIPNIYLTSIAKLATAFSGIAKKFVSSKHKIDIDDFETTKSLLKEKKTSISLHKYSLQCTQRFAETVELIEKLHSSDIIQNFTEDEDVMNFIIGFLDYNPRHNVFYKKLLKCFQKLIRDSKSSLSEKICEPFSLYSCTVDIVGYLDWRFNIDDFNTESVQRELEDIYNILQNKTSDEKSSINELVKKIKICIGNLEDELKAVEMCVSKISALDCSFDKPSTNMYK